MTRLIATLLLVVVTGCNSESAPEKSPLPDKTGKSDSSLTFDHVMNQINSSIDSVPPADQIQQRSIEEVEKLFRLEYRVVDFPKESPENLESSLAKLGQDGWECFSVLPEEKQYRVVCKRRPRGVFNYLKHVPFL